MPNLSGIKKVEEVLSCESVIIYDIPKGGRPRTVSLDENRKYIVPGYQREIRWSTENVQVLIDDLKKGSKFLGIITLSTSKPKEFELIDGQQRLTTIYLIYRFMNDASFGFIDEPRFSLTYNTRDKSEIFLKS